MVVTMMQAIKARREQRVLSLIDFGGFESSKMSTEQSRTVDNVSFMEGGKKRTAGQAQVQVRNQEKYSRGKTYTAEC